MFNILSAKSSNVRLKRIEELLTLRIETNPLPLTGADFQVMSADMRDGPEDSLWRTGGEWTLASWILRIPDRGDPVLEVKWLPAVEAGRTSEQQNWEYNQFVLDSSFWRSGLQLSGQPAQTQ